MGSKRHWHGAPADGIRPTAKGSVKSINQRAPPSRIVAMLNEEKIYKNPNRALRELSNGTLFNDALLDWLRDISY